MSISEGKKDNPIYTQQFYSDLKLSVVSVRLIDKNLWRAELALIKSMLYAKYTVRL